MSLDPILYLLNCSLSILMSCDPTLSLLASLEPFSRVSKWVSKCRRHGRQSPCKLFGYLTVNDQIWNTMCKRGKFMFVSTKLWAVSEQQVTIIIHIKLIWLIQAKQFYLFLWFMLFSCKFWFVMIFTVSWKCCQLTFINSVL